MVWPQEVVLAARVVVASLLGGLVGWQRERMGIEAGVRTFGAVALGSCAFGLLSQIYEGDTRIAAQVVSGIGFLGAGVILRARGHVHGLTTAAGIWATASIGLAVAYGRLLLGAAVAFILFALLSIPVKKWEREKGLIDRP